MKINKNTLTSYTLEEIISLGTQGLLPELDIDDWKMIESKWREEVEL